MRKGEESIEKKEKKKKEIYDIYIRWKYSCNFFPLPPILIFL